MTPSIRQAAIARAQLDRPSRHGCAHRAAARRPRSARARVGARIAGYFGYAIASSACSRVADDDERSGAPRGDRAACHSSTTARGRSGARRGARPTTAARARAAAAAASLARTDHDARLMLCTTRCTTRRLGALRRVAVARQREAIGASCRPCSKRCALDPAPHVRLAAIEVIGRLGPADAWRCSSRCRRSSDADIAAPRCDSGARPSRSSAALSALEAGFFERPRPWQRWPP